MYRRPYLLVGGVPSSYSESPNYKNPSLYHFDIDYSCAVRYNSRMNQGIPIHGEAYHATDASGGVTVLLYPAGSTTARALGTDEYLQIHSVVMNVSGAGLVTLSANTDAAGKRIFGGTLDANDTVEIQFDPPRACPKGVVPVFVAQAGVSYCVLTGTITKA